MSAVLRILALAIILRLVAASQTVDTLYGTASHPAKPVIAAIAITGNSVTRPAIILREMTLHVGDTLDQDELDYCRKRIYSLGLFNRVDIIATPEDSVTLVIDVDERWYLYPVPLLGIVDRDFNKWFYGIGVTHQNFRGWNEKVFVGFVLGYNPWASVSYSNPWIFGDEQMFSTTGFGYNKIQNKSILSKGGGPNFDEVHYSAFETIGKRFDQFHSAWLSLGYKSVQVTDNRSGRTISPSGRDRFPSVAVGAKMDTRNLAEYPTKGLFGYAEIGKKGFFFGDVDFVSYALDLRTYIKLYGYPTLALRAFTKLSSGPGIPNYAHEYFGFSERIRGHFDEEMEGEELAGFSVELRIPLFPEFYLHVPAMQFPEFSTWRLGVYSALFFDAGTTWYKHERPDLLNAPRGYGAGLHVLLPYSFVLRVDRAFSETRRGEWVFDLGASF